MHQVFVFAVLPAALVLFVWVRWRYDLVALFTLLVLVVPGIVPADRAFLGFGHPAVVMINNAAAAVLLEPVGWGVAAGLGASPDPFLMAIAVGASSAFLTPIRHQSNTLVMGPGGYRFGDYLYLGLPVSALVVALAVPLILWVWPL